MFDDLFQDYIELKAETLSSSCFLGDGKGGFKQIVLPNELQLAPIFTFISIDNNSFMSAGNFYGVMPYEGRYDALLPTIVRYQNSEFTTTGKLLNYNGEMRDAKWLTSTRGRILVTAGNDMDLRFYDPKF